MTRRRRIILRRLLVRALLFAAGASGSWLLTDEAAQLIGQPWSTLLGGAVAAVLYDLKDAR